MFDAALRVADAIVPSGLLAKLVNVLAAEDTCCAPVFKLLVKVFTEFEMLDSPDVALLNAEAMLLNPLNIAIDDLPMYLVDKINYIYYNKEILGEFIEKSKLSK